MLYCCLVSRNCLRLFKLCFRFVKLSHGGCLALVKLAPCRIVLCLGRLILRKTLFVFLPCLGQSFGRRVYNAVVADLCPLLHEAFQRLTVLFGVFLVLVGINVARNVERQVNVGIAVKGKAVFGDVDIPRHTAVAEST